MPSLLLSAGVAAAGPQASHPGTVHHQTWWPTVLDGGKIDLLSLGKVLSVLSDHTSFVSGTQYTRSYNITLSVSIAYLLSSAHVETFPLNQWGDPAQLPGGADALPPLSYWSWSVYHNGVNDTANWTVYPLVSCLMRTVAWTTGTYTVIGRVAPQFTIQVGAMSPTGQTAPSIGYVATDVLSPASNASTDLDFNKLARSVHPGLVRFGVTSIGMNVTWNSATNLPQFRWRAFDSILNFTHSLPAQVLMSLPAGSWGDGNTLPAGMPLNTSYTVSFYGGTGYFPNDSAYALYIDGIVQHVVATGINVTYWSIGNEVPRYSPTEVNEFIQVFNTAAATIHRTFPNALVGSDVMMDPKYIRQFALTTQGVGFLSFHYYPATGICEVNGTYCPPSGGAYGTTDPTIVDGPNNIGHLTLWDAPALAQMIWKNLTGDSIPVVDAETNLNHMGGQYTATGGTDPRIPTLFSASWLTSTLLQSVQQNLSSFLYFGFTGPAVQTPTNTSRYGGWGFQMTSEGTHDNDTKYAPYWAYRLWSLGVSPGAAALTTVGGDPYVVMAQAFRSGGNGLSVLVVNRVNATVHLTLNITGANETPVSLRVLGPGSYREVFDPATQTESLAHSALFNIKTPTSNPVHLALKGYSVALLRERWSPGVPPSGSGGAATSPPHLPTRSVQPPSDPSGRAIHFRSVSLGGRAASAPWSTTVGSGETAPARPAIVSPPHLRDLGAGTAPTVAALFRLRVSDVE